MPIQNIRVQEHKGLNNTADRTKLGLEWAQVADNVDLDNVGWYLNRLGLSSYMTGLTDVYVTRDRRRMYVIKSGDLYEDVGGTLELRYQDIPDEPTDFAEIAHYTFCSHGCVIDSAGNATPWGITTAAQPEIQRQSGTLAPGQYQAACTFVAADGRESGARNGTVIDIAEGEGFLVIAPTLADHKTRIYVTNIADSSKFYLLAETEDGTASYTRYLDLSIPLRTQFCYPPPLGGLLCGYNGQMFVAQYAASADTSVVFYSKPRMYHHFRLRNDWFMVSGRITMLADTPQGMVIGTDREIYGWLPIEGTDSAVLQKLADFGVPLGHHHDWSSDGNIWFWSNRGFCRALPLTLVSEDRFSVSPGDTAGGGLIEQGGFTRYVAMPQTGDSLAYNPYARDITPVLFDNGIEV